MYRVSSSISSSLVSGIKHYCSEPRTLPNTTVVKITREREVVTITSLLTKDGLIRRTRPKAIAPLIIPANHTKIYCLKVRLLLKPQRESSFKNPTVPMNLPTMMMISSVKNRSGDHLRFPKLKSVTPR